MHDVTSFGGVVLVWGLVGTAALLGRHVARWIRIPAPAVFLVVAAVAANSIKAVRTAVDLHLVENVVTGVLSSRPGNAAPSSRRTATEFVNSRIHDGSVFGLRSISAAVKVSWTINASITA